MMLTILPDSAIGKCYHVTNIQSSSHMNILYAPSVVGNERMNISQLPAAAQTVHSDVICEQ